jgi:glucosamine-phosphate N-acetyltransferase
VTLCVDIEHLSQTTSSIQAHPPDIASHSMTSAPAAAAAAAATDAAPATLDGVTFRAADDGDFARGLCALLAQLTVVGPVTEQMFRDRLALCRASGLVHIIVGELDGAVVAAATLLVEPKLVHACGMVGHIEDVVVDARVRGRNLGVRIIRELCSAAQARGCYKVILDCSEANAGFYEKCGFVKKELQMRLDFR